MGKYLDYDGLAELVDKVKKADENHNHDDRYYTESEIDTKLGNLTYSSLANSGSISKTDDFNNYVTPGIWTNKSYGQSNAPGSIMSAGILVVLSINSDTLVQIYFYTSNHSIYFRTRHGGTWKAWLRITTTTATG